MSLKQPVIKTEAIGVYAALLRIVYVVSYTIIRLPFIIKSRIITFLNKIFSDRYAAYTFLVFILAYLFLASQYRLETLFNVPINLTTISIIIPILLIDGIKITIEALLPKKYFKAEEEIDKVSVIIPSKDGEDTLPTVLDDLVQRFDRKKIIVASNGSTDKTTQIARDYGVTLVDIPFPAGKVGAINIALSEVTTPYTLIIDDDTLVGNAIMPTNMLDQGYEGVAFKVLPKKEGWLSILQLHEYRKSMDIGRAFHNAQATVQSVSGAIGLFHTDELKRQIRLHTGEFSGEDLQRTLLILVAEKRKGVVIVDSVVETYVPKTISELFNQRIFGWNPGSFSTIPLYLRLLFGKRVDFKLRLEALYMIVFVVLMDPLRLMSLPVVLFSPAYFAIFYVIYVLLECIPYVAMGRKEPFWVVLIAPLYGMFNFLARTAALASFTYRRVTYFIAKAEQFDDYRRAPLSTRILSFNFTVLLFLMILGSYSFFVVVPEEEKSDLLVSVNHLIDVRKDKESSDQIFIAADKTIAPVQIQEATNSASQNIPEQYTTIVKNGDSIWRVVQRLTSDYVSTRNYELTTWERNQLIGRMVMELEGERLSVGKEFAIKDQKFEEILVQILKEELGIRE